MRRNRRDVVACPVVDESKLSVGRPAKKAGGLAAVVSSQKFIRRDMGLVEGNKLLLRMNQKDGFDCPGCAWPDPEGERATAEFCENGAKALAEEATDRIAGAEFFGRHSVEELSRWSDFELGRAGRILQPMMLRADASHYQPISWSEAFATVARHMGALDEQSKAAFYTSGRCSNEAAYVYQLMVRALGTNNLPDCSNLCHESSGMALNQSIGIGKGTVRLEDFSNSELILVVGQNPGTNHPRMLSALRDAVKSGATIVSINPLFEAGTRAFSHPQKIGDVLGGATDLAQRHFAVKINGDRALFQGIAKVILSWYPNGVDPIFISKYTSGFYEWCESLHQIDWSEIIEDSGVERKDIEWLADKIAQSKKMISCWAMGLTQQPQAVETIRELTNLHLLGGFIGQLGSGVCPVRGHSNVQGDRTMGIYEKPSEAFIESLENYYKQSFPRQPGFDVVDTIQAMRDGRCEVLMCLGGNFLSASPDTELTADAIRNLKFSVQVSTKLNRSHLITGEEAIILPCLARSEMDVQKSGPQFVTVENSMGFVHRSQGKRTPRSNQWRSEVDIVCEIARRLLNKSEIPWRGFSANYDLIRDHIAKTIPGFSDFNQRLRESHGFYLPNPPRDQRVFETADGKANFSPCARRAPKIRKGNFRLMTVRSHDQYNTTIYGLDDRYRGIYNGRRVLFMNPGDIEEKGLMRNQSIKITSHYRGKTRTAQDFRVIPFEIPKGCVAAYFPEANVLIPYDSFAEGSQTPTSKFVEVSIDSI